MLSCLFLLIFRFKCLCNNFLLRIIMDTDSPVVVVFSFIYHLRNYSVNWILLTGCNFSLPGPEFLQDVQHIV